MNDADKYVSLTDQSFAPLGTHKRRAGNINNKKEKRRKPSSHKERSISKGDSLTVKFKLEGIQSLKDARKWFNELNTKACKPPMDQCISCFNYTGSKDELKHSEGMPLSKHLLELCEASSVIKPEPIR
jgi:hypothetical protein